LVGLGVQGEKVGVEAAIGIDVIRAPAGSSAQAEFRFLGHDIAHLQVMFLVGVTALQFRHGHPGLTRRRGVLVHQAGRQAQEVLPRLHFVAQGQLAIGTEGFVSKTFLAAVQQLFQAGVKPKGKAMLDGCWWRQHGFAQRYGFQGFGGRHGQQNQGFALPIGRIELDHPAAQQLGGQHSAVAAFLRLQRKGLKGILALGSVEHRGPGKSRGSEKMKAQRFTHLGGSCGFQFRRGGACSLADNGQHCQQTEGSKGCAQGRSDRWKAALTRRTGLGHAPGKTLDFDGAGLWL